MRPDTETPDRRSIDSWHYTSARQALSVASIQVLHYHWGPTAAAAGLLLPSSSSSPDNSCLPALLIFWRVIIQSHQNLNEPQFTSSMLYQEVFIYIFFFFRKWNLILRECEKLELLVCATKRQHYSHSIWVLFYEIKILCHGFWMHHVALKLTATSSLRFFF